MRIFYCPRHGRVTEAEYARYAKLVIRPDGKVGSTCEHCDTWYFSLAKVKVKRSGES